MTEIKLNYEIARHTTMGGKTPLWIMGSDNSMARFQQLTQDAVFITGSRAATPYGTEVARQLAILLPRNKTIITGGAYGIEAAAMRGMLAQGRPQVVFLANGLDVFYPRGNASTFDHVLDQGGLVVSRQPFGTDPTKNHFVLRNEWLVKEAKTVVVVEGARMGGAAITANAAMQHKDLNDVWAVPGPITSAQSNVPHRMIANGARPLYDIDSWVRAMSL